MGMIKRVFRQCMKVGLISGLLISLVSCSKTESTEVYSNDLYTENYVVHSPLSDLDNKHAFEIALDDSVELSTDDFGKIVEDGENKYVKVFVDAGLTQEFPCFLYQEKEEDGNYIKVEPNSVICTDETKENSSDSFDIFHGDNSSSDAFAFGRWYGYGGYYLVVYVGKDGKTLEKPEVTYFTVQDDVNSQENYLPIPDNVNTFLTSKGTLGMTWDSVEGADHYEIFMQEIDASKGYNDYTYARIGTTTETTYDSYDFDFRTKSGIENAQDDSVFTQNTQFKDFVIGPNEDGILSNRIETENDGYVGLEVADYIPNSKKLKSVSVSVVAVDSGDKQSAYHFVSINDLLNQMPIETANSMTNYAKRDLPDSKVDPKGFMTKWLGAYYLTMADGTVASQLRVFDFDHAYVEESGNVVVIPYSVKGTLLTGVVRVGSQFGTTLDEIVTLVSQAYDDLLKSVPQSGTLKKASITWNIDWNSYQDSHKPAKSLPTIPYTVNASDEYVNFIASNLINGSGYLDVTDYEKQVGQVSFEDALYEAGTQNPLILMNFELKSRGEKKDGETMELIQDVYGYKNTEELIDIRKQVNDKADEIVASIITDGMDDSEKVIAIDNYLCDNLEYDYDFLKMADEMVENLTDYGEYYFSYEMPEHNYANTAQCLINGGHAICSGYASAFKLLADKAGLQSIIATGTVPKQAGVENNGHAWNLVHIDNAWKVVDSTWNDTGARGKYLLISQDDPLLSGRSYSKGFMIDAKLTDYVSEDKLEQ